MEFNADRSLIWARAVCVLLLAYCMQAAVLFLARYVIYYTNFHFPLCLASFTFILASIMSLVAMILCQSTDDVWLLHGRWLWLQLGFAGACMGAATVSDYASLLHLPLSSVLCLKAGSPALSYILSVALRSEEVHATEVMKQLLVLGGTVFAALADPNLNTQGLILQAAAITLDICCRHWLANLQDQHEQLQAAKAFSVLANMAPFAVALLAAPLLKLEGQRLIWEFHRWNRAVPLVCVCGVAAAVSHLLWLQVGRLAVRSACKGLASTAADLACFILAGVVLRDVVTRPQLVGYVVSRVGLLLYEESGPAPILAGAMRLPSSDLGNDSFPPVAAAADNDNDIVQVKVSLAGWQHRAGRYDKCVQ